MSTPKSPYKPTTTNPYPIIPGTVAAAPTAALDGTTLVDCLLDTGLNITASVLATPRNAGVYQKGDRVVVHVFPNGLTDLAAVVLGVIA